MTFVQHDRSVDEHTTAASGHLLVLCLVSSERPWLCHPIPGPSSAGSWQRMVRSSGASLSPRGARRAGRLIPSTTTCSSFFVGVETLQTGTLLVVELGLLYPFGRGTLGRYLFRVLGTPADARTAFVHGDSGALPVSRVRGKSAGIRTHSGRF